MTAEDREGKRRKAAVVLGWVTGGELGLLIAGATHSVGLSNRWLTFGLFVAGALLGAKLGERSGARAFRPLGIAAGILLAVLAALGLSVFVAGS